MVIRGLPLFAGIVPVLAVSLAFWLGVRHGVLPACIPFIDGCASISATGRHLPGSLLFRAVMLPQAALLVFVWYFAARWLRALDPASRAPNAVLLAGVVGAVSLVLYVTMLGTRLPLYEFMRRFGIYFYFLGTAVAQVMLAFALLGHARRTAAVTTERIAVGLLLFCGLPFVLGVLNVVLKIVLDDANHAENRIEWLSALLMQGYFVLLHRAWVTTNFSVVVKTD